MWKILQEILRFPKCSFSLLQKILFPMDWMNWRRTVSYTHLDVYKRQKDMFSKVTKLQTRFFICYILAIFIPIMFLSSMIYYYHNDQLSLIHI